MSYSRSLSSTDYDRPSSKIFQLLRDIDQRYNSHLLGDLTEPLEKVINQVVSLTANSDEDSLRLLEARTAVARENLDTLKKEQGQRCERLDGEITQVVEEGRADFANLSARLKDLSHAKTMLTNDFTCVEKELNALNCSTSCEILVEEKRFAREVAETVHKMERAFDDKCEQTFWAHKELEKSASDMRQIQATMAALALENATVRSKNLSISQEISDLSSKKATRNPSLAPAEDC